MTFTSSGQGFVPPPDDIIIDGDGNLNPFSVRALQEWAAQFTANYNGGINFGDGSTGSQAGNMNAVYATVTTPGANIEFPVKHQLGRIPVGFDVTSRDKAGIVYDSRKQSWTASTVYLKCSTATTRITVRLY